MKKQICISVIMAAALLLAACEPESGGTSLLGSSDFPASSGPAEISSEPPETSSHPSDTSSGGAEELSPGDSVPVDEIRFGSYEVYPDGTLVLYDNETEYVMKYDPEAKEFIALAKVPHNSYADMWRGVQGYACVNFEGDLVYVNLLTGETTENRADLYEDEGVPEDIAERIRWVEENIYILQSDSFSVKKYGDITVYTYDAEPDEGGRLTGHEYKPVDWIDCYFWDTTIVMDRYFAGLYVVNEYTEEEGMGDVYYPYLVVYDYETNEFAEVIALDPEDCDPFAPGDSLYYAGGSRVLLSEDYDIFVDVVKLAGGVYEPVPLLGIGYTFRYDRERETGYSCDFKSVYAHPLGGESAVLYTWTADDRDICDFAVTENGTLAVIVMETDNRSLYVGGELLREGVYEILYADDESVLVRVAGNRLELIPMP